jgi:hypothetical protein
MRTSSVKVARLEVNTINRLGEIEGQEVDKFYGLDLVATGGIPH